MEIYGRVTSFHPGLLFVLFFLLCSPRAAVAAEFRVNTSYDANDLTPGNGLCVAYIIVIPPFVLPFCSLRGAIEETNNLPGPDLITLPAGTFSLNIAGVNEDNCATGDLDVTDNLTIRGAGQNETVIDGSSIDRVFDLLNNNTTVTLADMTITGGNLPPLLHWTRKGGAGIRNASRLTLRNVTLADNHVNGSYAGDVGGGLFNQSVCAIADSSVENNSAHQGGGIYNQRYATLSLSASGIYANSSSSGAGLANYGKAAITNVTVSGNATLPAQPGDGGGIYNAGEMDILQSTIAANTASGIGGGIWNGWIMTMINTIVADNTNGNCYPVRPVLSRGNNLDSENSCFPGSPGDLAHADPKLGHLADNGGSTKTHGLLIGSAAIDSGRDLSSEDIVTDQRGIKRPDGDGYDIGAYETRKKSPPSCITPLLL